jgi:hypothetical protein
MKTMIRIGTVIAVAVAFVVSASAADDGAKSPKGKSPAVVAGENSVMRCPQCKNDYSVKTTRAPKGSQDEKTVIAKHLCANCKTTLVTVGGGKAKSDLAVHKCDGCK